MAELAYTVVQTDVTYWGTLESIQSNLEAVATKQLNAVPDPLLDPTLANPDDAYISD